MTSCASRPETDWKSSLATAKAQWSIRINQQWRICFEWRDSNAWNVEIVDYR